MKIELPFHTDKMAIDLPDKTALFATTYPEATTSAWATVQKALRNPIASSPLTTLLQQRTPGEVVIVVSDISRPIPYPAFLPQLLDSIQSAGVERHEIVILIATGMHRPSTPHERRDILGADIAENYRVQDHAAKADDLIELPGKSWSGSAVKLNRRFVKAGFRIITGLVEPHFMAGFSGGRKAVCPGLAALETVQRFHGYEFLSNENATNGRMQNNPCHLEALSVAETVGVHFSLNVVLDDKRHIVFATAGGLDTAHLAACQFVQQHATPFTDQDYDVVLTSSAGYPLDTTFYQCVKGLVTALPVVKTGGDIIAVGGCAEGIGSESFRSILKKYSQDHEQFLEDIQKTNVIRDQWQFQMHTRVLNKVGRDHIHFFTDAIPQNKMNQLSVNGVSTANVQKAVQDKVDDFVQRGKTLCVIPEGPYCAPLRTCFNAE